MKYFVMIEYKMNDVIGTLKVDDFESDSAENAYFTVCNIFDIRSKKRSIYSRLRKRG